MVARTVMEMPDGAMVRASAIHQRQTPVHTRRVDWLKPEIACDSAHRTLLQVGEQNGLPE